MAWDVEYTDEFETWWVGLTEEEQIDIDAVVGLLEEKGPHLPYPYSSEIKGDRYGNMRELRIQHRGKPYRIEYFMCLTPEERPFCLLADGKPEAHVGMTNSCLLLKRFTNNI